MKVGEWHEFTVGYKIHLPPAEPQLILTASNGMHFLIPANPYRCYNFNYGSIIRCRIDKINCSGRIFLEPEHPYYLENEYYSFNYLRKEERKNSLEGDAYYWILEDIFGQEAELQLHPQFYNLLPEAQINCQILRIKKAKLFLKHNYSLNLPVKKRSR